MANSLITSISIDGKKYFAIDTGLDMKVLKVTHFKEMQTERGWYRTSSGFIDSWEPRGTMERDNKIIIYGPFISGVPLSEIDDLKLGEYKVLARFFHDLITEHKLEISEFSLDSLVKCYDGNWFLLPPQLVNFVSQHAEIETQRKKYLPFNYTGLKGEKLISFVLASLVYQRVCGVLPYPAADEEELQIKFKTGNFVEARLLNTQVDDATSAFLQAALSVNKPENIPDLEAWNSVMLNAEHTRPIEEIRKLHSQAEAQKKKYNLIFARKEFWRKKSTLVIIAAAIVLIIGAVLYAPVAKAFAPPIQRGLDEIAVLQMYYQKGLDGLDIETLDGLTKGKSQAIASDKNMVTFFFVNSRTRLGTEGKTGFIPYSDWQKNGAPTKLPPTMSVYGISDLHIVQLAPDNYRATYRFWLPISMSNKIHDDTQKDPTIDIPSSPWYIDVTDTISFTKIKDSYYITSITRQSTEAPVPTNTSEK